MTGEKLSGCHAYTVAEVICDKNGNITDVILINPWSPQKIKLSYKEFLEKTQNISAITENEKIKNEIKYENLEKKIDDAIKNKESTSFIYTILGINNSQDNQGKFGLAGIGKLKEFLKKQGGVKKFMQLLEENGLIKKKEDCFMIYYSLFNDIDICSDLMENPQKLQEYCKKYNIPY